MGLMTKLILLKAALGVKKEWDQMTLEEVIKEKKFKGLKERMEKSPEQRRKELTKSPSLLKRIFRSQ